jgi:hypothetical protein
VGFARNIGVHEVDVFCSQNAHFVVRLVRIVDNFMYHEYGHSLHFSLHGNYN